MKPALPWSMIATLLLMPAICFAHTTPQRSGIGSTDLGKVTNETQANRDRRGESFFQKTVEDLADPTVPRSELLRLFKLLEKTLPPGKKQENIDDPFSERVFVTQGIKILERMVREDAEHAKRVTKPLDQLPVKERVAELIFQLRDQSLDKIVQSDALFAEEPKRGSPDSQLVAIGLLAAPQLIDALSDMRFTRANLEMHNAIMLIGWNVRIRTVALGILNKISHRDLMPYKDRAIYSAKDIVDNENAQWQDAIANTRKWLMQVEQKGETQTDLDTISLGGHDAPSVAESMIHASRVDPTEAIKRGVLAGTEAWEGGALIRLLGRLNPREAVGSGFIKAQMTKGKSLYVRLACAKLVGKADPDAELHALISEWKKCADLPEVVGNDYSIMDLTDELIVTGRAEAIDAMADPAYSRAPSRRQLVLDCLERVRFGQAHNWEEIRTPTSPAAFKASVERFLVAELSDMGQYDGGWSAPGGSNPVNPRLRDVAADSLAAFRPDEYRFTITAPLAERNRQISKCQMTWRLEHPKGRSN